MQDFLDGGGSYWRSCPLPPTPSPPTGPIVKRSVQTPWLSALLRKRCKLSPAGWMGGGNESSVARGPGLLMTMEPVIITPTSPCQTSQRRRRRRRDCISLSSPVRERQKSHRAFPSPVLGRRQMPLIGPTSTWRQEVDAAPSEFRPFGPFNRTAAAIDTLQ